MSVADDGTLLHTVSVNLDRKRNTPLPSRCQWTQTGDIGHALKQHQMLVSRYFKQQPAATGCLVIDPQYALGVMDYAHRISGWSLVEYGIQRKRLPPLPRAEQLTRVVDGRKTFAWQARPNNGSKTPHPLSGKACSLANDAETRAIRGAYRRSLARYQIRVIGYASNAESALTTGICSTIACAMMSRSNGSR
jgi:hypothetical protein